MRYWIVTTGRGMLPAGEKVGEIEAVNVSEAKKKIAETVGDDSAGRWDYIEQQARDSNI